MKLEYRTHQTEMLHICDEAIAGQRGLPSQIIASVSPGGGKQGLALIFAAKLLAARKIDKICWVVPRLTLQRQAAETFLDPRWRAALGHAYEIRESTNEVDPSRGTVGYVTTYAALANDRSQVNTKEFTRYRYGLILDEPHHIEEHSPTEGGVKPLYELSVVNLLMSGTLERHNKRLISFLPYTYAADGFMHVDMEETENIRTISYSIDEALREKAIIKTYFRHIDGAAEWIDATGEKQNVTSFGEDRTGIYVALNTEYAIQLLNACLASWQATRKKNKTSLMLVVCASIKQAQSTTEYLKKQGIVALQATSDDEKGAQENIQIFKQGKVPVLVTVAMAYEGLDVPGITHLACLTHIRSNPWIIQMFARAWRFDKDSGLPWHAQSAQIFVPDDEYMRRIVSAIRTTMDRATLKEQEEGGDWWPEGTGENTEDDPRRKVIPLSSAITDQRASDIGGSEISPEETSKLLRFQEKHPALYGLSPLEVKDIFKAWEQEKAQPTDTSPEERTPTITVTERETRRRKTIDAYLLLRDRELGQPFGTCNLELRKAGWPKREIMTEQQLDSLWAYIIKRWPEKGKAA